MHKDEMVGARLEGGSVAVTTRCLSVACEADKQARAKLAQDQHEL